MTPISRLASVSNPVGGVTITATLTDGVTGQDLYVTQPDGTQATITSVTTTDHVGAYTLRLTSAQLPLETYGVRVVPSLVNADISTGIQRAHSFTLAADGSKSVFTDRTTHNGMISLINFYDMSSVPILGRVQLNDDPSDMLYGSAAFQGCGISNITINVYDAADTTYSKILASSSATSHDGGFSVSVPMFSSVRLVPVQTGVNRTFSPAFILVNVKQSLIQVDPFLDQTVSTVALEIDGGQCHFHVGSVRPTLFFDGCGPSAHVLLPAFADGAGYTYLVPSVAYTIKLFDPKNPFSGLQGTDLDGTRLPNAYLNGPVFSFVASATAPFAVDFSNMLEPQSFSFNYQAVPDFVYKSPLPCFDPKAPAGAGQQYSYFKSGGAGVIEFTVTDTYGYVGTQGEVRTSVCGNVSSALEFLDGATQAGGNLLGVYMSAYGCSTGNAACRIPTVFNAKSRSTSLTYAFIPGDIQTSDFKTSSADVAHTQPAYSRLIQYRLADSALPWNPFYAVIVGSAATGGTLSLVYPPYDALYILRDPPGGLSFAAISTESIVTSTTQLYLTGGSNTNVALEGSLGAEGGTKLCTGAAAGGDVGAVAEAAVDECVEPLKIKALAVLGTTMSSGSTTTLTRTNTQAIQFATTVTTSEDPNIIDGDGDLFLTIDGSFSLTLSDTVAVELIKVSNGGVDTTTCKATVTPSIVWKEDKGVTYQASWLLHGRAEGRREETRNVGTLRC